VDRRGDSAYTYLPASVRRFPPPVELGHVMQSAGHANVKYTTLAGGIVALHVGEVPL
jgi:demethylmenaquinone methyltransferase/2-methoxy-6-polyprenyl-1,4-benzoquinol methylase